MYPEDIAQFSPKVPVATSVKIVEQPFRAGWRGHDLYPEVHVGEQDKEDSPYVISAASFADAEDARVDWDEVRRCKKTPASHTW